MMRREGPGFHASESDNDSGGVHAAAALDARLATMRAHVSGADAAFAAGFGDRVMQRLGETRSFGDGLQYAFRRVAPLAAAAVLVIGAINLVGSRASDRSLAERVLGLPTVTVASAYTLDGALAAWGQ